jgi:hypothetical protein
VDIEVHRVPSISCLNEFYRRCADHNHAAQGHQGCLASRRLFIGAGSEALLKVI